MTSTTIPSGAAAASAGVNATWTRTAQRYKSRCQTPARNSHAFVTEVCRADRRTARVREGGVRGSAGAVSDTVTEVSRPQAGLRLAPMSTPMYCYRRPICAECMTPAPVGQRCPEHSGKPQGVRRVTAGARRTAFEGTGALVTKTLIGLNILVYVITAAQGAGLNSPGGSLFDKWLLFGPFVA